MKYPIHCIWFSRIHLDAGRRGYKAIVLTTASQNVVLFGMSCVLPEYRRIREISGSHGGDCEDTCLLVCSAV
jgi:hypothetical protein